MAKYKIGDKVRITDKKGSLFVQSGKMDKWLGEVMTIQRTEKYGCLDVYFMYEDAAENNGRGFMWIDEMISGPVKDLEKKNCDNLTVAVHFDGLLTTAELVKNGKTVKTAVAKCNPHDTYDRGEGAKIAINRLFEKKQRQKESTAEKLFIIKDNRGVIAHSYDVGTVVKVLETKDMKILNFNMVEGIKQIYYCQAIRNAKIPGMRQWVDPMSLYPYKGE